MSDPAFPLPVGPASSAAPSPAGGRFARLPVRGIARLISRWGRNAAGSFGAAILADRERWPLWLPVLIGVGALSYYGLPFEPRPWVGAAVAVAAAGWLRSIRRSVASHAVACGVLAAALGFAAAQWQGARMPPMPALPKRAVLLDGIVAAVDPLPDGVRRVTVVAAVLRPAPAAARLRGGQDRGRREADVAAAVPASGLASGPAPGPGVDTRRAFRVRLRPGDPAEPFAGDRIAVRALLRPPPAPDWPGGRDGQRDAFFSGLGGSGVALGAATVIVQPAHGLRRLREAVAGRIMRVLPGTRGSVAATLMTGLGTAIPQADRDAFAASGLAHILAVAGLHLGIVMGMALWLARLVLARWEWGALRLPCRQIAAAAALLAGTAYMAMTGLHLPGLRSLLMAAVVVLALFCGRRAASMRGLALAAAVILLWRPAQLLDVAFQMSFAAVLALLAGYEAARPLSRWLAGTGTASQPFAAFHFGRMQFYFVLANLLAVPVTAALVMPAGMLALLLMPFGLDRMPLAAMGSGIDLVIALARGVAALPAASLPVPATPAWGLLCGSFGLAWLCVWRRSWRLLALLPMLLGLASPFLARPPALLVSADAGVIAFRDAGRVLVLRRPHADPGTSLRDWLRDWGLPDTTVPAVLPDSAVSAGLTCNPSACLLGRDGEVLLLRDAGGRVADAREAGIEPQDCAGPALLVSALPAGGVCPGLKRIDRFTVWRDGPQAVWIGSGWFGGGSVRVWDARAARGARPWVPPDPERPRVSLPLAAAE